MRVPKMSTDSSMDMSVIKKPLTSTSTRPNQTLRDHVEMAMRNYFANLDGERVNDVYEMVLAEVETPLLEVVLEYTRGNQTRASEILGLNRGTLRKKLKQHGLMN
jgi:Fis family transcriptional regulator, factor for inversion stimulation protein